LKDPRNVTSWLWQGYLSPGHVTLLTSQWKTGKTTLISILLSRLQAGGQLAGQDLLPGRALVISEESARLWRLRNDKLHFADNVCWLCRPFLGRPDFDDWLALLDRAAEVHARHGLNLVVFDPLAKLLPGGTENHAAAMLDALAALDRLTALDLSILLSHHPRKGTCLPGQATRGSGALPAHVDILIEKYHVGSPSETDRRRRLLAFGRFEDTPAHRVIELSADGTDYLVHAVVEDEEWAQTWPVLLLILEDATRPLTGRAILERWPEDHPPPSRPTLARLLKEGAKRGHLLRDGKGRCNDAFRYWLPGHETRWENDPIYRLEQMQRADQEALRQLGID
jgi:hypothetical protein